MNRMNPQGMLGGSNKLLEGSIAGSLFRLGVPIMLANILQTAYQLTDTFWVGRLGAEAVAAVSISFPLIFLTISLGMGLSLSGAVLVAQNKGRGDQDRVNYYASQTLSIIVMLSMTLSVLGFFFSDVILGLLNIEESVFIGASQYMRVTFIGFTFLFGFFVVQGLLRGVGDVITPMYIVLGTVLLNLILDPLFIFGWGPIPAAGVAGAAWATLSTQGLACIVAFLWLITGNAKIQIEPRYLVPQLKSVRRIFSLGLPASVEQSVRAMGLVIMTILVTTFGTVPVASYGIGTRIMTFVIIPAMGLAMATSTLVGQNIGAGQKDRARQVAAYSAWLTFGILSAIGIVVFFFAQPITAVFIPDDPEVIAEGSTFIRIFALTFGFIGVQQVIAGSFRGAGNTIAAMTLAIISLWGLQFPLAFVLSRYTELAEHGIWWSFAIANVISATISLIWFLRGRWMRELVDTTQEMPRAPKSDALQPVGGAD